MVLLVLLGALWILPAASHASPVPVDALPESSTSGALVTTSGPDRWGAAGGTWSDATNGTTEGGNVTIIISRPDDNSQFVFPEDTSEVGFVEGPEENNEADTSSRTTASSSTTTTTTTTATTTTTPTAATPSNDVTKGPPPAVVEAATPKVVTATTDLSLDDRSLFDVPDKTKCDNDKQRAAKDGSCRTAIKQ